MVNKLFRESSQDLDEYTDVLTSYINFSENVCVPSKPVIIYNKPWFSREINIEESNRHCADELTTAFTDIFNRSLKEFRVPAYFKSTLIIPVPKKSNIRCLHDYRPVALTSVQMQIVEHNM